MILSVMYEHFIMDQTVPRTTKVVLFNNYILDQVTECFWIEVPENTKLILFHCAFSLQKYMLARPLTLLHHLKPIFRPILCTISSFPYVVLRVLAYAFMMRDGTLQASWMVIRKTREMVSRYVIRSLDILSRAWGCQRICGNKNYWWKSWEHAQNLYKGTFSWFPKGKKMHE